MNAVWIRKQNMKMKNNRQHRLHLNISSGLSYALLAILICFSSASYAVSTFVLGNIAPDGLKIGSGPTSDGSEQKIYASAPTVVFSRTPSLAPANVLINWDSSHGSSAKNASALYCTQIETGTGNGLSIQSSYVSAGSYGGVEIFKTNITGLYFSMELRSFSTANEATVTPTRLNITSGIAHQALKLAPVSTSFCARTNKTGGINYGSNGGLGFYMSITFYTDQTYTPGPSSVSLLKTDSYDFRIWNENPGSGIKSYHVNYTVDISSVVVNEPTCSTQPVASGNSVNGTTVDLGTYSPNDIIKGAAPVPFAIKLAGCKGLRNINVTLTTTTMAHSPTMLGNILTQNNATGVGVEISGAANSYSSQMVMLPNDTTSIYNDQRDTSSDNNIYGNGESGTTQSHTLNFLATLKRDGTQQIGSGHFKANGIFTIDYP
ncbi:hypothetical protein YR28_24760 [Salmonella enterica subsp. enterica]|nr:hypothetical protein [Salmonella enterica subsp. enterica]